MEVAIRAKPAVLFAPMKNSISVCNVFQDTSSTPPEDAASALLIAPLVPHLGALLVNKATS